jgi:hypothetical protein
MVARRWAWIACVMLLAGITAAPIATAGPSLLPANRYVGPLYSVSEKVGDNPLVLTRLLRNMERNRITTAVLYFGIESAGDADFIERVVRRAPGRIVPFYSTGVGGSGEGRKAGPRLVRQYAGGLAAAGRESGRGVIRGIGEVELYAWRMPHDDARVLALIDFASRNDLAVMAHPSQGRLSEFEVLLDLYPDTVFLMHMFALDFERDRQAVIDLMGRHDNVYYTVDVDHLLLDRSGPFPIGLLYAFADLPTRPAVSRFVEAFDARRGELLAEASQRYLPLVTAHPDRVMWGTEMSADYTYDPRVYDRMISFAREWIGSLPAAAQPAVASGNAHRVLGKGVTLR